MNGVIRAYSLKEDGENFIAKHFQVKEFASKDGADTVFVAALLPMVLEAIRSIYGKALNINSAYRTDAHNKAVGGEDQSRHTRGMAADVWMEGVSPEELAKTARTLMPDWGGIGVYDWGIHIDVRKEKADWKG